MLAQGPVVSSDTYIMLDYKQEGEPLHLFAPTSGRCLLIGRAECVIWAQPPAKQLLKALAVDAAPSSLLCLLPLLIGFVKL
jgi:hypothetical protein